MWGGATQSKDDFPFNQKLRAENHHHRHLQYEIAIFEQT